MVRSFHVIVGQHSLTSHVDELGCGSKRIKKNKEKNMNWRKGSCFSESWKIQKKKKKEKRKKKQGKKKLNSFFLAKRDFVFQSPMLQYLLCGL